MQVGISRLNSRFETLHGFKKYALAFALGGIMALCMPPVGAFPLLFLSVPGLIALCRAAPTRLNSFLTAWAFGAGYFIFGLYWISAALFVDIEQFKWVMPLSLIVGPAALGLYYGFIPLLAWRYRKNTAAYALMFTAIWAMIEWLRGHLFTGFPWNLAGYSWSLVLPVMQTSAVVGIYGLTLLTFLWATIPLLTQNKKVATCVSLSFLAVLIFGVMRIASHPVDPSGHTAVRVVQANISEKMKWNDDDEWRNLERHVALSETPSSLSRPIDVVIWPETSVGADMSLFPDIAQYIAMKMPKNATGILGTLRVVQNGDGGQNFFNSVSVLDQKAKVTAVYDKHHLVPFGEYIPWRNVLNLTPVASTVAGLGDFTPGTGARTLTTEHTPPFSPLICYEVIFPREVVDQNHRPDWMVNVTNDAWYGHTAGPYQHFDMARMRAIEEGLPIARAANTGISAIIDPVGRIISRQPLGASGVADALLPPPLPPTLYAKFGDRLFFAMLVLLIACAEFLFLRQKHAKNGET